MSDENQLQTAQQPNQLLRMASAKDMLGWYKEFQAFTKEILKKDLDYGEIPGTQKPTLLKPGAEKLRFAYGLQTETVMVKEKEGLDSVSGEVALDYTYRTTVKDQRGNILATSDGNCNSFEPKYRYLWKAEADLTQDQIKEAVDRRADFVEEFGFAIDKAETTGQYGKPQEYWDQWKEAIKNGTAEKIEKKARSGKSFEAYRMGSYKYRIINPDLMGMKNTIMKMADKRSFVGAMLKATGASEFFTQDVEDMEGFVVEDDLPRATAKSVENVQEGEIVEDEKPKKKPAKKKTTKAKKAVEKNDEEREKVMTWVNKIVGNKASMEVIDKHGITLPKEIDECTTEELKEFLGAYKKAMGK